MHTSTITDDDGREWTLHHNGDYSGLVHVILEPEDYFEGPGQEVRIPFEVMKELVGRQQET